MPSVELSFLSYNWLVHMEKLARLCVCVCACAHVHVWTHTCRHVSSLWNRGGQSGRECVHLPLYKSRCLSQGTSIPVTSIFVHAGDYRNVVVKGSLGGLARCGRTPETVERIISVEYPCVPKSGSCCAVAGPFCNRSKKCSRA